MVKLPRIPDRTTVKLTLAISPELNEALVAYAAAYQEAYGAGISITELAPAMLSSFIESDRQFVRSRQAAMQEVVR
jgi:hypothetical protein